MSNGDRLKVLFTTGWYPNKEQPTSFPLIREHAKAVSLYDDVVVPHCAEPDSNLNRLWRLDQETDESITEGIPTYRVWYKRLPIPKVSYFIYVWCIFQAYRWAVAQGFRPDIIHAHVYGPGLIAVLIGKLYRVPVVITEHYSVFHRRALSRREVVMAWLAFRQAKLVLPVSFSLQKAIERYGIRAKFRVVPNVVDTALFFPPSERSHDHNPKRILFVGSLNSDHRKGVPILLQALTQLHQQRDNWHLDIVGDGPARAEYERMALDLRISDNVTFHGVKSHSEVAEFMRQMDFFVLPSIVETFSVVTAEALATGMPVVATRSGGPEEFVTDEVGMLVAPGNVGALEEALQDLLDSFQNYRRETFLNYARENYSPEVVGRTFHDVYLEVIS